MYWLLYLKTFITNPIFGAKLSDVSDVCEQGSFLDFPRWYKYLDINTPTIDGEQVCSPAVNGLSDVWLIALAVVEILLRIAIIVAVVFVLIGGIKFILARGNPDKISNARTAVQDALIGLVIAISATALVSFIAGRFSAS